MSKCFYVLVSAISLHLWGCSPVAEKKDDAKKIDTLSIIPQPKVTASAIDTVGYAEGVQNYADSVDKNLTGLAETKIDVFGASSEGGEISVYTNGSDTLKLKASYYGETGNNEFELYLRNKKLVLFSEKTVSYKSPIGKNPVKVSNKNSKSFVLYDNGIVLGREGGKLVPRDEYVVKFEDIRDVYKEIKLQLRE